MEKCAERKEYKRNAKILFGLRLGQVAATQEWFFLTQKAYLIWGPI